MRAITILAGLLMTHIVLAAAPLGLPPVPVPANNPQSPEKIALGDRLFNDERFRGKWCQTPFLTPANAGATCSPINFSPAIGSSNNRSARSVRPAAANCL